MLVTSFGLSALLEASETAFQVVKYLGVAYLVWLGVQKLWLSRGSEDDAAEPPQASLRRTARARRRLDRSSGVVYLLLGAFAATVRQA